MSPIHVSWKKMAESMRGSYKGGKTVCRGFTDNSKVCMSDKAWSVFFATINKMGADETKPRPKKRTQEAKEMEIKEWYLKSVFCGSDISGKPKWLSFAESIVKSKRYNEGIKRFWQNRLEQHKRGEK